MYNNSDIVLTADDHVDTEFRPYWLEYGISTKYSPRTGLYFFGLHYRNDWVLVIGDKT